MNKNGNYRGYTLRIAIGITIFALLLLSGSAGALAPTATTLSATSITSTSAVLKGTVNPISLATQDDFASALQNIGSATSPVTVTYMTGLTPGTTNYYNVRASNSAGNQNGIVVSFTTLSSSSTPSIYSQGSLNIPQTWTADLDGGRLTSSLSPPTDIWFEAVTYTDRYIVPENGAMIAKVGTISVGSSGCSAATLSSTRININDLPVGTFVCVRTDAGRYSQFRVDANVGPSPGTLNISYTTWETISAGSAPTATTLSASNITSTSATLSGSVNPNGLATQVDFASGAPVGAANDWGISTLQNIGSATSPVTVTYTLIGLTPGTTYYYNVRASNSAGNQNGLVVSFTTQAAGSAPTSTTLSATGITSTSATLQGSVNPNGLATQVDFASGSASGSPSYFSPAPLQNIGSGTSSVAVSYTLTGLTAGTTYSYVVRASNSAGSQNGAVISYTTLPAPTPTPAPAAVSTGSVTRAYSTTTPATGATITVTLTPAGVVTGGFYQVIETLPAGFTFVSTDADNAGQAGQVVTFTKLGGRPFTYTVTAPATAGTVTFTGTFKDYNRDIGDVTGANQVNIATPAPAPTITPRPTPTITTPQISTGSISISSIPSGASIYIDSSYEGVTPKTITDLPPGNHFVELSLAYYKAWAGSTDVQAGITSSVSAQLAPAGLTAATKTPSSTPEPDKSQIVTPAASPAPLPSTKSEIPWTAVGAVGAVILVGITGTILQRKIKKSAPSAETIVIDAHEESPVEKPESKLQQKDIIITSAFGYKGATILYKVKVENTTPVPIADIKISLFVPDVFLLLEKEKSITLLTHGESKTVTFEIRPTGECGDCEVSGKVTYYDTGSSKKKEMDIGSKMLSIICPMLKVKEISEPEWQNMISNLLEAEESTKEIDMPAETLFTMASRIIKDMHMHMQKPEIMQSQQIFSGVARFYGEGVKGLRYAAQVEVVGGAKKSKLILKAWAEKEDALTGFYHGMLDEIEKRINVKGYIDEPIVQHFTIAGHYVSGQVGKMIDVGDKSVQRSNIEENKDERR